jgi:hypothetical protein
LLFSLARKSLSKQKVSFFMDDGPSISQDAEFENAWEIFFLYCHFGPLFLQPGMLVGLQKQSVKLQSDP